MASDEKAVERLLHVFLSQVHIIRYTELASSSIIVYDHLLTLDQEYNLIWASPWSIGKCLFLLNRYYTLLIVIFNNYALFSHNLSDSLYVLRLAHCLNWYRWQGWTGVTSFVIAELILQLRLYALYFHNKRVLAFMGLTTLGATAASAGIMGSVLSGISATANPFPGRAMQPFCVASGVSAHFYAFWIPMLVSECVLCALAATRFVQVHKTRAGATMFQKGQRLVGALVRDSVWYFLVMFATYLANTLVFVVGTTARDEIPIGFSVAFACVLGSRLCLNARCMIRSSSSSSSVDRSPSSAPSYTRSSSLVGFSWTPRPQEDEGGEDGSEFECGYEYEYDEDAGGGDGEDAVFTVHSGERLPDGQLRALRRMRSERALGGSGRRGRSLGSRLGGREERGAVVSSEERSGVDGSAGASAG